MLPAEGEKKYLELLRQKSAEDRLKITFNLNQLVKKMAEDGIRNQLPQITSQELNKQLSLRIKK